jgi:hypothetical protein
MKFSMGPAGALGKLRDQVTNHVSPPLVVELRFFPTNHELPRYKFPFGECTKDSIALKRPAR